MTPETKTVNFRFTERDLFTLEWLAALQNVSRTEVLRQATGLLRDEILHANRDATAVLEVLRERYGSEAEVTLWVSQDADGNPQAHVRINGQEPTDLSARVMVAGEKAIVFLNLYDADSELVVPVGKDYMRIRSRLNAGVLPWPPQPVRIVIPLGDLAASSIPEELLSSTETAEA